MNSDFGQQPQQSEQQACTAPAAIAATQPQPISIMSAPVGRYGSELANNFPMTSQQNGTAVSPWLSAAPLSSKRVSEHPPYVAHQSSLMTPVSSHLLNNNQPHHHHHHQHSISRQSDALSLDTIAVALHELEQLSWNKRSLSVNSADLKQAHFNSNLRPFGATASSTPLSMCSSVEKRPQQTALTQRHSCEPPLSPTLSSAVSQSGAVIDSQNSNNNSIAGFGISSPINCSTAGFFLQSPPSSGGLGLSSSAASVGSQQRRSVLSSSVPGSLDSYQIETDTIDSGLGNDRSFFLLPTLPALSTIHNQKSPSSFSSHQPSPQSSASQVLRHSAYQNHLLHRAHQARRSRASLTGAQGGSTSRRHLHYFRHHLQARQKPYHFPASCVTALRKDTSIFNVPNYNSLNTAASAGNNGNGVIYLRHSCSVSSQSRSITPGSSPTRSSEVDSLIPATPLMRSRSLDDVHHSANVSSVNSLGSRPGHASGNQSDLGQWDYVEPDEQDLDELTVMSGVIDGSGLVAQAPPLSSSLQQQQSQQQVLPEYRFFKREWPHSKSMLH